MLAVALDCQSIERVATCTFVQGTLDGSALVRVVPRAAADVVLYVNVTRDANDDLVHLRVVGQLEGTPDAFEQLGRVDTRAPVDEQREAVDAVLFRALAPYVAAQNPDAVRVSLVEPEGVDEAKSGSPYAASAWGGGWGSWTAQYQELSAWVGASASRITDHNELSAWAGYDRSITRQPTLVVKRQQVSLSTDAASVEGAATAAVNLPHDLWTLGAVGRAGADDPEGQFRHTAKLHLGVERNWFPSADPRGNRLAAAYLIGAQSDAYHQRTVLGDTEVVFASHLGLLSGSVRFDTVELSLDLAAQADLVNPLRRYALGADGNVDLTLGDHVDLFVSAGVTQQAIPGPADLDLGNFEQLTRASYAQPLSVYGNTNLRIHFDNTNGARNNRFQAASNLGPRDNL
ncbi:MAG: hypothetical protein ABMA64_03580 [Myxococcota bacterium]